MKILFVHNALMRFVEIDLNILRELYEVEERYERSYLVNPFRIWAAVNRSDIVFSWFASWHSLLPVVFAKLQGKKSVTVIGGYDTANIPESGYGSQRGGIRAWIARIVMHLSHYLLAFSESAKREAILNVHISPRKIGVGYCGVQAFEFGTRQRENMILTVGSVWQDFLLRKGLLAFVKAAAYFPDYRFVLVGKWQDDSIHILREIATANVEFTGFVNDETLSDYYQQAAVYVQASLHEGFGMSVAEAMTAGCIPVTTRAGSLPEVVGDTGVFITSTNPEDIADSIQKALNFGEDARLKARERVLNLFSLEKRRQNLVALLDNILAHG